ncbi:MAG: hypothetical protein VYD71_00740 [Bacteroidota bacterium]|nr:hypothetical protein [Bacteroidota bacterium]
MKKIVLTLLLAIVSLGVFSQGLHATIFSNFNYDLSAEEGAQAFKEFEIKRAYLGYSHQMSDVFSAKVTFDVGTNEGGSAYTTFLKIASLNWDASDNLSINFGMVGTKNFKFMEKAWGKRYVYKSFQDQSKWANSADAGATFDYSISENLSVDGQILNGEGYKKIQGDNALMRGGIGMMYSMKSIKVRLSRDMMPRSSYTDADAMQNINTLALLYTSGNLTVGGEYNMMENSGNTVENTSTAMSVYGTMNTGNYSFFARYDDSSSEDSEGERWNVDNEGSLMIFGIERKMSEAVKASINVQSWTDATLDGDEEAEARNTLYLNLEYKF